MDEKAWHIMLLSKEAYYKRGWIFETGSDFFSNREVGSWRCDSGVSVYIVDDPHGAAPDPVGRTLCRVAGIGMITITAGIADFYERIVSRNRRNIPKT